MKLVQVSYLALFRELFSFKDTLNIKDYINEAKRVKKYTYCLTRPALLMSVCYIGIWRVLSDFIFETDKQNIMY